jgi:hypothetical protein
MDMHVRRPLTKWGNGWGLRLTKKEVEKLGVKPGEPVEADLRSKPPRNPIDQLPSWNLGGRPLDDDELADAVLEAKRGRR